MFLLVVVVLCGVFAQTNGGEFFSRFSWSFIQSSFIGITADQFDAILPLSEHPEYLEHLNSTLDDGEINSCERQSAFIAQTAQESAEYNLMVEQGDACEDYPVNFPCPQLWLQDLFCTL